MEFIFDPSIWAGLLTLIVLEIVLGIDNVIFIAILADKLPAKQRDKARIIGLSLAVIIRLLLLSLISWLVTLTNPLFSVGIFSFSGRDIILLAGGIFLLFKATTELHERLEGHTHDVDQKGSSSFWLVVAQIVVLDAVFSLDAVITAVGMVNSLPVMISAVLIAMAVMLLASKMLTNFVNAHPTVVVLCLSFLLMIGLSLMAEGMGLHIPKGYLYAAIGFSIVIEMFNQIARRNHIKHEHRRPMRQRTAEAILALMGGRRRESHRQEELPDVPNVAEETFAEEERYMISGVLALASRSLRTIMTPRNEISWVDSQRSSKEIRIQLLDTPHSLFPVCDGELDNIIGVVRAKDLLVALEQGISIASYATQHKPIVVLESMDVINFLGVLRRAKGHLVMVNDEFGCVQGIVTPLDVLEAIAGEFPDEDETPDIVAQSEGHWLVKGGTDLHMLAQVLGCSDLLMSENTKFASLAGLLIDHFDQMPQMGESILLYGYCFTVVEIQEYRIELIQIDKHHVETDE